MGRTLTLMGAVMPVGHGVRDGKGNSSGARPASRQRGVAPTAGSFVTVLSVRE